MLACGEGVDQNLAIYHVAPIQQQEHLGADWPPDVLSPNLHVKRTPRGFMCTPEGEQHCTRRQKSQPQSYSLSPKSRVYYCLITVILIKT